MDEAEYCNTIGIMYGGQLIALASPHGLRDKLSGVLYQIDCNHPRQATALLDTMLGVLDAAIHGVQVHVLVEPGQEKMRVKNELEKANIRVDQIEEIQPSLEDIFISMVGENLSLSVKELE